MPAPQPTLIRGTVYPSQAAAARAIGVHHATVHQALERGKPDGIGAGLIGRPGIPCYINGKSWPSRAAAARAIGVRPASIGKALEAGRTVVRVGGVGEWL